MNLDADVECLTFWMKEFLDHRFYYIFFQIMFYKIYVKSVSYAGYSVRRFKSLTPVSLEPDNSH